jgi:hypothetical protein
MRFGELAGQVVDVGLLVLEFGLVLVLEGGDLFGVALFEGVEFLAEPIAFVVAVCELL